MRKATLTLLWILIIVTAPVSTAGATPIFIEDSENDFTDVAGQLVKQPFLDIRNVTADYDETSDKILVKVGFFAPLPSEGPIDSPEKSSSYYYACNFMTGENTTIDGTTVILEEGSDWSSAYLRTQIRGSLFEGSTSPVKYKVEADSIIFTIPAHILTWGERPKKLFIAAEAGQDVTLPSGVAEAAYYDCAPEESQGSFLTFEVPPAPLNLIPLVALAAILVLLVVVTWRIFRRHGGRSLRRR